MAKKSKGAGPMDVALSYLTARSRTVREMELHLDDAYFGEVEVYECVERLKELGYLDDGRFAADFVESRLRTKPISRRKLREQLYAHKLPPETVDTALAAVTDEIEQKNAAEIAKKYWRQFEALEDFERKGRVMRRLMGRGYDLHAIRQSVEHVIGDLDGVDLEQMDAEDEE
ncbi:MAG: regulatory protein RecX [Candidatus Pelethousia sp.]|nr:regulatory protein RecX [Candidatus Pelethousia sp.]